MTRWLPILLTMLSLLFCVASSWLWWRSDLPVAPAISIALADTRYTVRTRAGRVVLFGPPGRGSRHASAAAFGTRARNNQVRYSVLALQVRGEFSLNQFTWDPGPTYPVKPEYPGRMRRIPDEALRPLLAALEDPRRFAAAHLLLCEAWDQRSSWIWYGDVATSTYSPRLIAVRRSDGLVVCYDGLRLEFPPSGTGVHGWREFAPGRNGYAALGATPLPPDPTQLPELRALWHDRLDVPVASVPLLWVVAASAVLPAVSTGVYCLRARARHLRTRLGHCPRCGYDLTGNVSGVCPECGAPTPPRSASARFV